MDPSAARAINAARGRKAYTLSVGRVSATKLANFAEIECFVLIAGPEDCLVEYQHIRVLPCTTYLALDEMSQPVLVELVAKHLGVSADTRRFGFTIGTEHLMHDERSRRQCSEALGSTMHTHCKELAKYKFLNRAGM